MSSLNETKTVGSAIVSSLVDSRTKLARFTSIQAMHAVLSNHGFNLALRQEYGPPGGRQLFYQNGRVVVRVKTKGDAQGFRANQPHLSVSVTDGKGFDWQNDQAKFNASGGIAAKVLMEADKFKPVDFQGNPQRFVVIMGGKYDGKGGDAWAKRTHFPFPPGFNDAGVDSL